LDARSAVGDLDRDVVAGAAEADDDECTRGMLAGVVEEVGEDPLQAARIRVDDDVILRQLEDGIGMPAGGNVANDSAKVDRLGPDLLAGRIEARELHQILDEVAEPPDVLDDELT